LSTPLTTQEVTDRFRKYVITSCVKKLEPIVLVRGRGAVVTDLDGKDYIDCWSGIAVSNVGHCHPKVVDAAKKQLDEIIHCCSYVYHTVPAALLAERLYQILPGSEPKKTFFANSGAEAIECAMKIARKFTKRHEFIALQYSFHGRTIGTLSVTGQAGRRRGDMGPYLGGVSFAPAPYCYRCSLGQEYPGCNLQCAKVIEDVVEYSTSRDVAAFIAEPLLGEGGIITPPTEYFIEVKKVLDRYEIPFIDDEVQTGFGRTGRMFGIEHYGVDPDVICMAKAIAGGLPLGACTARGAIGDAFEPGDHLSTFGGNPVSCAASLATIQVIEEEKLVDRAEEAGAFAVRRLKELQDGCPLIGEVRGKGLMIGVELVKDPRSKEPAKEEAESLREMLRMRGVLIGIGGPKGNVLRLQPPLVVTDGQMEQVLQAIEDSLKVIQLK
jgi:4-aminobutyrate aminotransferase/(S)-3-amino-2-methylpropionate transaminase